MKLIIASNNAHKIREIKQILGERFEEILSLKEVERREIQKAIAKHGTTTQGKRTAAKELGIGLATLYRKLEELGI